MHSKRAPALTKQIAKLTETISRLEARDSSANRAHRGDREVEGAAALRFGQQLAILEGLLSGEEAVVERRTLSQAEAAVRLGKWLA